MTGRRPQGQGTGSDRTREREITHGPGRGMNRDHGAEEEDTTADTRAHTQEGHATTEGPPPPCPQQTPRGPRRRTPQTHAAEARIRHTGSHPLATQNRTGEGGHTYTGRRGYTHRGSRREHRRTARHNALTAR